MTAPVPLVWMRARIPHTPAHRAVGGNTAQGVTTACNWRPAPGGWLMVPQRAAELGAFPCTNCFPRRPR